MLSDKHDVGACLQATKTRQRFRSGHYYVKGDAGYACHTAISSGAMRRLRVLARSYNVLSIQTQTTCRSLPAGDQNAPAFSLRRDNIELMAPHWRCCTSHSRATALLHEAGDDIRVTAVSCRFPNKFAKRRGRCRPPQLIRQEPL